MRLGIVRESPHLATVEEQRRLLDVHGCDSVILVGGSDFVADRRVRRELFKASAGDEVVVARLGVLCRSTGGLTMLLRSLLETGVTVHLAHPAFLETVPPDDIALRLLNWLVEQERVAHNPRTGGAHQGGSRNPLSKYQIEYARRLYADGESLRAIGLIFQLPPSTVWEYVGPAHASGAAAQPELDADRGR